METVIRIAVFYLLIMISLRILGKREFSQLTPFELVTLLLIPEIVSQSLVRDDSSITNAVIGLCTLFVLVFLTSVVTHRSKRVEEFVEGKPSVLVSKGRFVEDTMNKERVTPDEIYTEMHKVGLSRIEQVQWAILESDGMITLIPFELESRLVSPGEKPII